MIYNDLIAVFEAFLGPAAQRFVNRQIEMHLSKNPDQLTQKDVEKLTTTCPKALKVMTRSTSVEREVKESLEKIAS